MDDEDKESELIRLLRPHVEDFLVKFTREVHHRFSVEITKDLEHYAAKLANSALRRSLDASLKKFTEGR